MNEELLFRYLFVAIYAAFFIVRIHYRLQSIRREPEQRYQAEATKILYIAIPGYFISIVLYMLAVPWASWSQIGMPSWLRWLGVIGAISSVPLLAWTHRTLGWQYSAELAIQKKHALVTTGPYARARGHIINLLTVKIYFQNSSKYFGDGNIINTGTRVLDTLFR